ncbi:ABC-three component system middle component 2 [Streptomyces hygroscopicus]|uniref:ABC-three component system middle component 2 n=1 Tax=Streptomyces hygroscopicus TaxID=1912 RepID=UPI0008268721|nr:ABC-three component system middle component 2 [Streptomyces hygroscopicus]
MNPLNSPLEVGVRALALLAESHPEPMDLAQLVILDYALLHSAEFDGPPSLHPDLPARTGELGMKRHILEQGLLVLIRAGLAGIEPHHDGLKYRATERGPAFIDILEAPYADRLRDRAEWAVHQYAPRIDTDAATRALINRPAETPLPSEARHA